LVLDVAELSDPGRDPEKQVNEDACASVATSHGFLMLICDGMGGHSEGQVASATAVSAILESLKTQPVSTAPTTVLVRAIEAGGRAVFDIGGPNPAAVRPGSTCVAALLHDGVAELAHVGDSRAYLLRGRDIQRLTRDHSMVQEMIDAGVLKEDEAKSHPDANRITRALGMRPDTEVECRAQPQPLLPGDILVLCTDGLTDLLSDQDISLEVQSNLASGVAVGCQKLVERANQRGGHDNITVQIARIVEAPKLKSPPEPTLVDHAIQSSPTSAPTLDGEAAEQSAPTARGLTGVLEATSGADAARLTEPLPLVHRIEPLPLVRRFVPERLSSLPSSARGKSIFLIGVVLAAAILGGIVVWWLLL
jgi:serine/threonine protein phosphatase PrpC